MLSFSHYEPDPAFIDTYPVAIMELYLIISRGCSDQGDIDRFIRAGNKLYGNLLEKIHLIAIDNHLDLRNIQSRGYDKALLGFRNDVLAKTDGVAAKGVPDKNDYVTTGSAQAIIYPKIVSIVNELQTIVTEHSKMQRMPTHTTMIPGIMTRTPMIMTMIPGTINWLKTLENNY
ncbi:hypothetical protein [uncultured Methanoregula sp.]|uniref:hypothetical protein n=1 Tax=uncultured Methanoregula sp. TaxID=1005933 RepID=UPI002AABF1B0|nr:hypothetical protein [uncultured Methanoregula sp.]